MDLGTFDRLLAAAAKGGASDVHFKAGAPPAVRINGVLTPVRCPSLAADDMEKVAGYILAATGSSVPDKGALEKDTSYAVQGVARFRVNLYRQMGTFAAVLRVIRYEIPTFAELGLPPAVEKIAEEERGLVLVTGVTGSGKSSTLAAMVGHINATSARHIVTIEDPIEFIHEDRKSRVSQREIGSDTESFASALRAALRQNPDVILVGELRDFETIDIALKAAETGLLVMGTVHTTDAVQTISRIIGVFPTQGQDTARMRLADSLKATISQRLIPSAEGKGRVLAAEILMNTFSAQSMIRNPEKMGGMRDYLEKGRDLIGTQTFDQHLLELQKAGKITLAATLAAATNPGEIQRKIDLGE